MYKDFMDSGDVTAAFNSALKLSLTHYFRFLINVTLNNKFCNPLMGRVLIYFQVPTGT